MLTRKFEGRRCRIFVKEEEEEERVFQLCVGSAARRGRGWLESRSRDVASGGLRALFTTSLFYGEIAAYVVVVAAVASQFTASRRTDRERRESGLFTSSQNIYALRRSPRESTPRPLLHTRHPCVPVPKSYIALLCTSTLNHLTHINHESTTTM